MRTTKRGRGEEEEAKEDEEWQSFRRITGERKGARGKKELEVEWEDGTRSWIERKLLEGQDAVKEWDEQEAEEPEVICDAQTLHTQVQQLAQWMKAVSSEPRRIVFHVGAGMSAEDGVPTFRGVGGLWTRGRADLTNFDLAKVEPGYPYRAMVALERAGYVYWVVTQNYDNLFRKSGFPSEKLSEVHGNIFVERCSRCGKHYERPFPVEREDADGEDHSTGRNCDDCGHSLEDILVHFGEQLRDQTIANAKSKGALLSIAIGSKLMVTPASTWVMRPHQHRPKGKVVIVNTQKTPCDAKADMVIHHKAGEFLRQLTAALNVQVE